MSVLKLFGFSWRHVSYLFILLVLENDVSIYTDYDVFLIYMYIFDVLFQCSFLYWVQYSKGWALWLVLQMYLNSMKISYKKLSRKDGLIKWYNIMYNNTQ